MKENKKLFDRLREWRLATSIEGEALVKGLVCFGLVIFFALLQTTLFARYRPFGGVPDLILPLVIAISMTERQKWGAVFGIIGAFIIESLGGASLTLLPLLYMPAGYICGLLTIYSFRDSPVVRALFTSAALGIRVLLTAITILSTVSDAPIPQILTKAVLPEFISSAFFAFLPHSAAYLALRPFNKPRAAKVKDMDR